MAGDLKAVPDDWIAEFKAYGYEDICDRGAAGICGTRRYLYTGAIVTKLDPIGHSGRYCYGTIDEARTALVEWDGSGDPPGMWIKFKSAFDERLGPGCEETVLVQRQRQGNS